MQKNQPKLPVRIQKVIYGFILPREECSWHCIGTAPCAVYEILWLFVNNFFLSLSAWLQKCFILIHRARFHSWMNIKWEVMDLQRAVDAEWFIIKTHCNCRNSSNSSFLLHFACEPCEAFGPRSCRLSSRFQCDLIHVPSTSFHVHFSLRLDGKLIFALSSCHVVARCRN